MYEFLLMIVNIALKIKKPFYKLIALGLGTEYAFQVFLTIGGATKFYPYDRCNSSSGQLWRKFCRVYSTDAGDHSGIVYFERKMRTKEIERYRRKGTAQRVEEAPESAKAREISEKEKAP